MRLPAMWRTGNVLWVIVALALVCLMPSNQSLWIDEGTTAYFVNEPTLSDFVERLGSEQGSDAQWPLGMLYFWAGSRIFGDSELGLRTLSALWIAVAVIILWRVGSYSRIPYLPVLFACNAFAWYYGGEARPYAMQIALGAGLLYAFVVVLISPAKSSRALCALLVSGTLLSATGMLGVVPFAVVAGIFAIIFFKRGWRPRLQDFVVMTAAGLAFGTLGSYYAWTLAQGKGAGTVGTWGVGAKNLFFAGYEMLGFVGFGPGRYELRELGLAGGATGALGGLFQPLAAEIAILVALYVWAALRYLQKLRLGSSPEVRLGGAAGVVIVASASVLLLLSLIVDFPFWGRHLAPVFPFVVFLVAIATDASTGKRNIAFFALPLLLCLTLLASSLRVRFHQNYFRDDYRSATQLACSAARNGKSVWWAAGTAPAAYYGVTFCEEDQLASAPCLFLVSNSEAADLAARERPDMVLLSKPDLYDKTGALRLYFRAHDLEMKKELMAFKIFGPASPDNACPFGSSLPAITPQTLDSNRD